MSIKINQNGKEIEVFTKEELESQVKAAKDDAVKTATEAATKIADDKANAAIEAYKSSNPDKTHEIEDLKTKLADAETRLKTAESYDDKSGNRDEQIRRLKEERDQAIGELNKKIDDLTKVIESTGKAQTDSLKGKLLDQYSGGDVDKRKVLELEFDKYNPNDLTPEGIENRMKAAAKIAGIDSKETPSVMDAAGDGSRRGDSAYKGAGAGPSANAVAIGKAVGVSEQDIKDHIASKNNPQ